MAGNKSTTMATESGHLNNLLSIETLEWIPSEFYRSASMQTISPEMSFSPYCREICFFFSILIRLRRFLFFYSGQDELYNKVRSNTCFFFSSNVCNQCECEANEREKTTRTANLSVERMRMMRSVRKKQARTVETTKKKMKTKNFFVSKVYECVVLMLVMMLRYI